MARVVKYDVQSDLSGVDIAEGDRCIVRFEFDAEDKKNYVADLSTEEAVALIEHTHAREAQTRERKPKENGDGNGNGDEATPPAEPEAPADTEPEAGKGKGK